MTRYESACQQATQFLALVREMAGLVPGLSELPAIAALTEEQVAALLALGAPPEGAEAQASHQEAWQAQCKLINKQVRALDEELGRAFLARTKGFLRDHQRAMERQEAALAREAGVEGLDETGRVPGRAAREAAALSETWPVEWLDLLTLRERVRRARLGRFPAGFAELEGLMLEMGRDLPHVLDVSGQLAELHRRRTWEVGFYPVLDVLGALIEAIDLAFLEGVTTLAASAPKKVSLSLASELKRLAGYRARAEALTAIALADA